ncbi:hypothetical protein HPB51_002293 [Rhipicephalus microplus]|uniref:CCHC-type domain-containing protein n=1 Tax=Rhipicephalus microplus TaxID=6941 RepID=A0A9J6D8F5_RHIMP|nr:hypothetical protein HPB51_002293 [Rhipicephalus microplus]
MLHCIAPKAITKAISTLDTLLADSTTPAHRLQELIDIIVAKHTYFITFDKDIQATLHGKDLEVDLTTASEYEDRVICAKGRVRRATKPQSPTPPAYVDVTTASLGFWDQFQASIHNDDWIPKIDKLQYLLIYLTGAAKAAIQGIRLAKVNYDVAIQILSDRFGCHDMLVDDHLDSLLSIAPVQSSAGVTLLRNLHDEPTFRINALEGLKVSPGENATVLRRDLLKALLPDLGILCRQRQKKAMLTENATASREAQSQVKDLLSFIKVQVEVQEESGLQQLISATSRRPPQRDLLIRQPPLPSAAAFSAELRSPYSHPCVLCTSPEHTLQDCSKRFPLEDIQKRLHQEKLRFRCGKRNHFANDCRSARTLQGRRCTGQHLTSLCDINNGANHSQHAKNTLVQQDSAPAPTTTQFSGDVRLNYRHWFDASRCIDVTLRSQHSSNETIEALAIPEISPVTSLPSDGEIVTMIWKGMLPANAHPDAMTLREDDISVLIGSDLQGFLRNLTQRSGARATFPFIAIEGASKRDANLEAGITNFWRLDSLGIQDDPDSS